MAKLSHLHERHDLALAYRAIAVRRLSVASGLGNHLTMSVDDGSAFLVNRYGLHWIEVTAENLLLVSSHTGAVLEGEGPVQGAAIALHAPIHLAHPVDARVVFHTHQPWCTALACLRHGGLRMLHPDAAAFDGRVGFDAAYTGNWPVGSRRNASTEGERILGVAALRNKSLGFLANHGTMQIAHSVGEALYDLFASERVCELQAYAMARDPAVPELPRADVDALRRWHGIRRMTLAHGLLDGMRRDVEAAPLVPTARAVVAAHPLATDEVSSARADVADACRMLSRLNGHVTYVGAQAHLSLRLRSGAVLSTRNDLPFATMRASDVHLVDEDPYVSLRTDEYPVVLHVHTTFTDRLSTQGSKLRLISQSSFNFRRLSYVQEPLESATFDGPVAMSTRGGGVIARGGSVAHVYAIVQGLDAASEIQAYAELTRQPLVEFTTEEVDAFPEHGYGNLSHPSKRMSLNFEANKRTLRHGWNQGFRQTKDPVD